MSPRFFTCRIFLFFGDRGRGRGSPRRREEEGSVLLKSQEGGGGLQEVGGSRPGGCLQGIGELGGGGGLTFVSGPKSPPSST